MTTLRGWSAEESRMEKIELLCFPFEEEKGKYI